MVELGPYLLQEPVARGGMAEVWRAVYEPTDTPLAVKVSRVLHPHFTVALHGEAAVLASFRSPYLVAVHDFGGIGARQSRASNGRLPEGAAWMAMEWVPYGVLEPELVHDWWMLRRVLLDLLLGLSHAHAHGVLHRDVKPENVLIASRNPLRVKLTDFGIAFARERWLAVAESPTKALTPRWAAPEQFRGELATQGPWTDLYLLGCVAWHLLTGVVPFQGRSGVQDLMEAHQTGPIGVAPPRFDVPDGLAAWVDRLLQKAPQDRFLTAPAAVDALLALDRVTRLHRRHWSTEADPEAPPPRGADDPGPGVFANRRAPLVAREAERDRLWSLLYSLTVDRIPRAVLVHGPSGVGTSALAHWLVERALETGTAKAAIGDPASDRPLADLVARHLGGTLRRTTELLPSLSVHFPDREGDGVVDLARWLAGATRPERSQTFQLAARVFARTPEPTVIWVDAFVEGELLAFARWVGATRAFPALFVFTEADDRAGKEPSTAGLEFERVPLGPLTPETLVRLIQSFGAIDQLTAVRIADRAAGLPRLATEILRSVASAGSLKPTPTGWRLSRKVSLPMPEATAQLGDARLDQVLRLVPRSLASLTVAAVLGAEGDVEEWREVAARARILTPDALVPALQRLRLLAPRGDSYGFHQPALLDAVTRRTAERHPPLHAVAAQVLEVRGGDPARIGRHWVRAGEPDRARGWLLQGLERDLGLVRQGVCLDLLEEIVPPEAPERVGLLFKRIERARVSGRVDAAFEAIRKLLALARRKRDDVGTARALMQRAVLRVEGGDDDGAIRDAREAARLAAESESSGPVADQTRDWFGLVLARTGRLAEARAVLEGLPGYLPRYGLGMIALDEGRVDDALSAFEEARRVLRNDPLNEALLENAFAECHLEHGRLDTAEALAGAALRRLTALQTSYVGDARVTLGFVHLAQLRWSAAEVVLRPALADNDDARRAAIAGLALASARSRRDPLIWLQLFEPRGLRMSMSVDRRLARTLDATAATPDLSLVARALAEGHVSVLLARCRPVTD